MSQTIERRHAYLRIGGTITSVFALLFGALLIGWGQYVLNFGTVYTPGRLLIATGVVVIAAGLTGIVLLVRDRVHRRYPD